MYDRRTPELRGRYLRYTTMETPLGELLLAGSDAGLRYAGFPGGSKPLEPAVGWEKTPAAFADVRRALRAYFSGERPAFEPELDLEGTPFQLRIWRELRRIPYGETTTYAEIARSIGRPTGARAVGGAVASNPIALIVPCHRVIGSDGRLTGYRWGMERKRVLLDLERSVGSYSSSELFSRSAHSRQRLLSE